MKTSVILRLVLGLILTFVVACSKPQVEAVRDLSTEIAPTSTSGQKTTATSALDPTNAPPPLLTALPTTTLRGWQSVGNSTSGLQLAVPGNWVNLSDQMNTAVSTNQLGLITLLAADSATTGERLLNDKQLENGAFAVGLVTHLDFPLNTPQATLSRLTSQLGLSPANGDPILVTANTPSGSQIPGAYIDIVGDPLALASNSSQTLQTRLFLYTSTLGGAASQPAQAIFLFTAPTAVWDNYAPTFNQIADTAVIHNINNSYTISGGKSNVVGNLGETDMVNGNLEAGINDVWTFNVSEPRYATISIKPANSDLDLTFSIFGPNGQTIINVDNGYAGSTEIVTDLLLTDSGLHAIEIGDFFNIGGRYTVSLILTKEPLYGGGGDIALGQIIESNLPLNGQHSWTFNGDAGKLVTIVLTPEDPFDAILELYAPDGRKLFSLDEGYSGDAEVSTGLELPLTGLYTIAIRSFAGDGGRYALSLDSGSDLLANFYDAGDLAYGDARTESLQTNEAHAWFFNGNANDEVAIKVTPLDPNLDLDLWLLDEEINRLAQINDTQTAESESITTILPNDGQFLILLRDFSGSPGRYTIQLSTTPTTSPNEAGRLAYGDSVSNGLLAGQQVIWYFDAQEGENVTIAVTPTDAQADFLFQLYDPNEQQVLRKDTQGSGTAELLSNFQIPINGRWGIVVQEFFNAGGNYTITIDK